MVSVAVAVGVCACSAGSVPASPVGVSPGLPSSAAATATPSPQGAVPTPDHVVVVVLENKDVDQVLNSGRAPYLDELAATGVNFTNAHAETHPSQPNYLALFSGDFRGVTDNSCLSPLHAPNLGAQLIAAGRSFVGYSEDLPEPGFTGCRSGGYAQKHAPWAMFTNLPATSHQPWSAWPNAYEQLPTVAFVIPNLCNDMHDCAVAVGDRWLRQNLSGYLAWAHDHNSVLLITFDESESAGGDNQIVTVMAGANLRSGQFDERIDHYRLLRTIEDMYRLPALGHAAAAAPITDVWAAPAPR
jgi:acid phosphatase